MEENSNEKIEKFIEAVKQGYAIDSSDDLKLFMELEHFYTEMGEYLYKMATRLGIAKDYFEAGQ